MILPDSSVWIDHLRRSNPHLNALLAGARISGHPFVTGEVAMGTIASRERVIANLSELPQARLVPTGHVAAFIEAERLWGRGIGYVDVQLLASVRMTPGMRLWTRDRRLREQAEALAVAYAP